MNWYCHVAPGAFGSKALGGTNVSMMPGAGDQLTVRVPGVGCEKVNVYWLPEPVTVAAGMPSINKSAASTPRTALVKVTVIWVRFVTRPGGGDWLATRGGA